MFPYKSVVVNFSIFSHAFPFNLIDFSQSTTMNNEVYLIKRRVDKDARRDGLRSGLSTENDSIS